MKEEKLHQQQNETSSGYLDRELQTSYKVDVLTIFKQNIVGFYL